MAPRARQPAGSRPSRVTSRLGQLDTTPTSRQQQPAGKVSAHDSISASLAKSEERESNFQDEFATGLDDEDLLQLDSHMSADRSFSLACSESESITRRSSPIVAETPKDIWDFGGGENEGSSLPPQSSPNCGLEALPDTVPIDQASCLVLGSQTKASGPRVDLSETASTMRRSSPFRFDEATNSI